MPVTCSIIIWVTFQFSFPFFFSSFSVTSTFKQWVSITVLNHHMFTQLLLIHFLNSWLIALYSMKWTVRMVQGKLVNEANYVIVHSWPQRPLTITRSGGQKMMETNWQAVLLTDCLSVCLSGKHRNIQTGKCSGEGARNSVQVDQTCQTFCHWCRTTILKWVKIELKRWFCNTSSHCHWKTKNK